jgi:hypothetical protein
MSNTIPDGYWQDAKGCLIPDHLVKPIDAARDALVRDLVSRAEALSADMRTFRALCGHEIAAFVELSAEQYGVKWGGKKGNITLYSFDGARKIQIQVSERITFDERLQAAKQLIDECINRWSEGSRSEIRVLVQSAFQTDKQGQINTGRVLALRQLDIRDPQWTEAMRAIGDSVRVVGSQEYIRFYTRIDGTDQYRPVLLDLSGM